MNLNFKSSLTALASNLEVFQLLLGYPKPNCFRYELNKQTFFELVVSKPKVRLMSTCLLRNGSSVAKWKQKISHAKWSDWHDNISGKNISES